MEPLKPRRKLCILISAEPGHPNFRHGLNLAVAATKTSEVYLYITDEAVEGIEPAALAPLIRNGCRLFACALAAHKRNKEFDENIVYGGLGQLSELIFRNRPFRELHRPAMNHDQDSRELRRMMALPPKSPCWMMVISSDPAASGVVAEAIRMAAGVAVWGKVKVLICLRGKSLEALARNRRSVVDGDSIQEHLGLCLGAGGEIYAVGSEPILEPAEQFPCEVQRIGEEKAARLAAAATLVSQF